MIVIDKLCYYSKLRYINIEEKALYMLVTLILCITGRSILLSCLVLTVNAWLTVRKGGTSFYRYMHLMQIPFAFLILGTATILVNFSPTPMDGFSFPIGSIFITGSRADILFCIRLFLSTLAGVSCLYFFTLSTPVTDFLTLLQRLHVPPLVVELMLLIYRFIFILLDTASAIRTAQDSRLGNKDYRTSLQSFGMLGTALFIRAIKRSNALFDAMESRCYNGKILVLTEHYPAKKREAAAILLFELLLLACIFAEYVWF